MSSIRNLSSRTLVKSEYVLNGLNTTTIEAFYDEISQVLLAGKPWRETLDDLDDVLDGNYGELPETFQLVWCNAKIVREALSYPETVKYLNQQLRDCHPTVLIKTAWALRAALRGQGATLYDWIVDRIRKHSNIDLVLVESEWLSFQDEL